MKTFLIILTITIVIIASCSQGYIVNMKDETNHPEGRELYISKCNSCHQLFNPNKFTETEWDTILVPMEAKSKLQPEQRDEIYKWILEVKKNDQNNLIQE